MKYLVLFMCALVLGACASAPPEPAIQIVEGLPYPQAPAVSQNLVRSASAPRQTYSRRYYLGPRGGCYYLTGSGNRSYVDRSHCR